MEKERTVRYPKDQRIPAARRKKGWSAAKAEHLQHLRGVAALSVNAFAVAMRRFEGVMKAYASHVDEETAKKPVREANGWANYIATASAELIQKLSDYVQASKS